MLPAVLDVYISALPCSQLILLCELFSGRDICEHLVPVAMTLVGDKVAEVRQISCRLVCTLHAIA